MLALSHTRTQKQTERDESYLEPIDDKRERDDVEELFLLLFLFLITAHCTQILVTFHMDLLLFVFISGLSGCGWAGKKYYARHCLLPIHA